MTKVKPKLERSKALSPDFYADKISSSGITEPTFIALKGPLTVCRFGQVNFGEMQCWFTHEEYLKASERAGASLGANGSASCALREILRDRLAIRLLSVAHNV
jgi:hypothetical protein